MTIISITVFVEREINHSVFIIMLFLNYYDRSVNSALLDCARTYLDGVYIHSCHGYIWMLN